MDNLVSLTVCTEQHGLDAVLRTLYGEADLAVQRQRYLTLLGRMMRWSPGGRGVLVSAPGRTELGGNHTDHNGGVVLAAGVHFDCLAVAAPMEGDMLRIRSEGFPDAIEVNLNDLASRPEEAGTSAALVRGVAHSFRQAGHEVGGFDACVASNVPVGAGLSSSAAFEVCIGRIFNQLYNDGQIGPVDLARFGQEAENVYFGKPCGLMDQLACACQGVLSIDFADRENPVVREIDFDFAETDYQLAVVDTGGSHADLTSEYAAIPEEMGQAARALGQETARGLTMEQVLGAVPVLRREAGDRALLRLIHFIEESDRAESQAEALRQGDMVRFLDLVIASGDSSWRLLQNCVSTTDYLEQSIPLALTMTERFLGGNGAWRIQGGGFAGTIQVYVPKVRFKAYCEFMNGIFGPGSVLALRVRKPGNEVIQPDRDGKER